MTGLRAGTTLERSNDLVGAFVRLDLVVDFARFEVVVDFFV